MKNIFFLSLLSCTFFIAAKLSKDDTHITIKNESEMPFAYLRFKVQFTGPHTSKHKSFAEKGHIRTSATAVGFEPGSTKTLDVLESSKKIRDTEKNVTGKFTVTEHMKQNDMNDIELLALVLYMPVGDGFKKLKTNLKVKEKSDTNKAEGSRENTFKVFKRGNSYFVEADGYGTYRFKEGKKLKPSIPSQNQ